MHKRRFEFLLIDCHKENILEGLWVGPVNEKLSITSKNNGKEREQDKN